MEERSNADNSNLEDKSTSSTEFPFVDVISVQSIVNVLVRKGICSFDELFEEEKRHREFKDSIKVEGEASSGSVVQDEDTSSRDNGRSRHRHRMGWFKRKMSKRRWTRRVGRALFGWEWKKTKTKKPEFEEV